MRILVLALLLGCAGKQPAPAPAAEAVPLGKLPADVRPTHYALTLSLDPEKESFSGTAEIDLALPAPRSVLWLHGRGLHVTEATLNGQPARYEQVDESGVVRLTLSQPAQGNAKLHLAWDAPYDAQLVGVYRTKTSAGMAVYSKFEAIYARRAFPGFDEPDVKVPYAVTLRTPEGLTAISNSLPAESAKGVTRFRETPPLPAYLVAFAVGNFDLVDAPLPPNAIRKTALPLRGVAPRGNGPKLGYALREAASSITELERQYGLAFPYDKCDLIAIPDFQSGAMENAGAITFRDQALLIDEATASFDQKKRVASTIAHELAHQWFGDLVTMEWWDDLWLNEGFATYMEGRVLQETRPDLRVDEDEVLDHGGIMGLDELVSARKVRQEILTPHDITNAFDNITYQKGSAILGMFERWAGSEKFREGIRAHLRAHQNGNATTAQLLDAVSAAAGSDLRKPFESFLDQPGVPLIEASVSCGEKSVLHVKQSRSLPVGSKGSRDLLWQLPFCARTPAGETCALITQREQDLQLQGCPAWLLPNADAAGYFRWALAPRDLAALREQGYAQLSSRERISYAQNLVSAFRSAALPAAEVLKALLPLAQDGSGAVASQPLGPLTFVHDEIADAALRPRVQAQAAALYAPLFKKLGWRSRPGDSADTRQLRQQLAGFLTIDVDEPAARAEAARLGREYLKSGPEAVENDLLQVALAAAAIEGGQAFFDAATAKLFASSDAQLRQQLLVAVSNAREPAVQEKALQLAFDPRLRQTERALPLFVGLRSPRLRDAAWEFLERDFDKLAPLLPDRYAGFLIGSLSFCDEAHAQRLEAFFRPRVEQINGGPRQLLSSLEKIGLCTARVAAQGPSARAFFEKR